MHKKGDGDVCSSRAVLPGRLWVRQVGHIINPGLSLPGPGSRRLVDEFEGCLSVPGAAMAVPRTARAVARGFDKDGNPLVIEGMGYFARCLQHETDHLVGHTCLDRLSERDRKDALRQMDDRLVESDGPVHTFGRLGRPAEAGTPDARRHRWQEKRNDKGERSPVQA